ncbi:protein SCO1/2 [Variovorax paradoxus]|uniref:Protein SCO1/2 n=1 Tax=Variovorax paradoxus TaxID=34073 RepID=A0AAW8E9X8_VARPD|nr:SCO family protein [Variovorax paradoxus]MDP9968976.1 protein SCO1/2 [Variovorax paradoxus]
MKLASTLIGFALWLSALPVSAGFANVDLSEAPCCSKFVLSDPQGKTRTIGDYQGKVVVITFGFTNCPDVCPTTLQSLAETMSLLGNQGQSVQVLFVTLDPQRDTAQILSKYVPSFNPSFVALRGSDAQTAKAARDFRVTFQRVPGTTPGTYTVDHTIGVYVLDKSGKARVFARSAEPRKLAADIRQLL